MVAGSLNFQARPRELLRTECGAAGCADLRWNKIRRTRVGIELADVCPSLYPR
jgi:hypothetical protein